jgi:hypothetical protein
MTQLDRLHRVADDLLDGRIGFDHRPLQIPAQAVKLDPEIGDCWR